MQVLQFPGIRRSDKPKILRDLTILLCLSLFTITIYAIYAWSIFFFGGSNPSNGPSCYRRRREEGFQGNSDLYGLGIRLGFYIQLATILFTNVRCPELGRELSAGFAVSSLALMIALLLVVYEHTCAFTAEVFILLAMLFGGGVIVIFPLGSMSPEIEHRSEKMPLELERPLERVHGFHAALEWYFGALGPVLAWF